MKTKPAPESLALRSAAIASDIHLDTAIASLTKAHSLCGKLLAPQITSPIFGALEAAKEAKARLAVVAKRIP